MHVGSIQWTYDLSRRIAWTENLALKSSKETSEGTSGFRAQTFLIITRLDFLLWQQLEYGVEYRVLRQKEAANTRAGWLNELLYPVGMHLRIGVGFNFTDFSDNEFSNNDYSVYGWFMRLQGRY